MKALADNLGALVQYWPMILQVLGYVGLALLGCGAVYAYLKLNALAYRRRVGRPRK